MTRGMPDIDDLIGSETDPHERERLARAHLALARSEPFPELPASLAQPPGVDGVSVLSLSRRVHRLPPRWRGQLQRRAVAAATATVALAGGAAGYLATAPGGVTGGEAWRVVAMHATSAAPHADATLRVGSQDHAGNWSVTLSVHDLPRLPANSYYEMLLTDRGRLVGSCGSFRVGAGTTVIHLNVPYELGRSSGWLIRREAGDRRFGPLLLRT